MDRWFYRQSQREGFYESAFRQAPVAMSIVNREGGVLEANGAFVELLKESEVVLIGRNLRDFVLADDVPLVQEALAIAQGKGLFSGPTVLRCLNGEVFAAYTEIRTVQDGSPDDWLGVNSVWALDTRGRGGGHVDETARLHRLLAEQSSDVLVRLSTDGVYEFVSPASIYVCGYRPEEMIGRRIQEFIHPEDREGFFQIISRAVESLSPFSIEFRRLHKAGHYIWLSVYGVCVRETATNQVQIVCSVRDTTDRRRIDDERRHSRDRLEQILEEQTLRTRELERQRMFDEHFAMTGRLAAQIAHEINNPLAGAMSSLELIASSAPGDHPYREFIGRAQCELDRITEIVQLLFSLCRSERPAGTPVSPVRVVGEVIALVKRKISGRRSDLPTFKTAIVPAGIDVILPESFLRQILFNLVLNGCEATAGCGQVDIQVDCAERELVLKVQDTGSGIAPEIQSEIFRPFFTTKTTYSHEGMGLGLSITRDLVHALGGTIDFDTVVGEGTTFRVRLPIKDVRDAGVVDDPASSIAGG